MGPVEKIFEEHLETARATKEALASSLERAARLVADTYSRGGKVLLFGNGGSAADALHLEGELIGRFLKDRPPLPAMALGGGIASLTAMANDFSYDRVFARAAAAHIRPGDAVLLFSTSGNSPNIIEAAREASRLGASIIGFTGEDGGALKIHVDLLLAVPSRATPRIQEMHLLMGHILCGLVEEILFG